MVVLEGELPSDDLPQIPPPNLYNSTTSDCRGSITFLKMPPHRINVCEKITTAYEELG